MIKKEFVNKVHNNLEIDITKKTTEYLIECTFNQIKEAIKKKESVAWPEFGKFEAVVTKAKKGRNPATGKSLDIPAKNKIKFKPAVALKNELN